MKYFHLWSGGKDSTASIILDHIHGLPPSTIIMSEVMFDNKRGISGELPEHMEWVHNEAVPMFQKWGYEVNIVRAEKDYLDYFHGVIKKSKILGRNGKKHGFPLGRQCAISRDLKIRVTNKFFKTINDNFLQYIGIAADEPKRLERLNGTNKVSLLARYNYTEQMAFDLCHEYDLLSPIYDFTKRGGCWFCPNQSYEELAYLKKHYLNLWKELEKLSREDNLVTYGFKYNETFTEVNAKIDDVIVGQEWQKRQFTLFDYI